MQVASQHSTYLINMSVNFAQDKNNLLLFTDNLGTEQLELDGGNVVDAAGRVYTYNNACNKSTS
jgi:hypothetical protein